MFPDSREENKLARHLAQVELEPETCGTKVRKGKSDKCMGVLSLLVGKNINF